MAEVKTFSDAGLDAGFLMSEAPGRRSRDEAVLAARTEDTIAGTILGQVANGAVTVTPVAGGANVGNGAIGTVTADAGAPAGVYRVEILNPVANAGAFRVLKPDGTVDGVGTVAVAYNGTINFTLADGATDFAEDDFFQITVAYATGSMNVAPVDLAQTDGRQNAVCILLLRQALSTGTKRVAVVSRDCEVDGNALVYPAGATTNQKAALDAQLKAKGILVRR